ncbi:DNA-binding transcriptional regulator, XRE-family HTH domain [Sinosporangium album]|uniref:DNA-binding transcriptional regulator, XRE-family HTH domain n=1 Tax=Sinosporangium album TaxID=504805 RepID=A0A1G7VB53_9ACTN|nr:helix-turn-helix transcriptional regulator [Sinosporangium album]SDG56798.1 DNA-binding transcriptional regulator, XRE-family HTH domain [Sinosporangium album]
MSPVPRTHLAGRRRFKGLTQETAAEAVGVTPTTWARWERGQQGIRAYYWPRIAEILGVQESDLARLLGLTAEDTPTRPLGITAVVDEATRLWRSEMETDRRALLAALPFIPSALGEWLLSYTHDTPPAATARQGPGPRVGLSDATRIREARDAFKKLDSQFGGGMVRSAVVDYLHTNVTPLLKGTYTSDVGAELLGAAAYMTGLAAWTAFDLEQHGQAQQHYTQALSLAKAGGDTLTAVWLLSAMSLQAFHLDEPRWAQRLTSAAQDTARKADAPPVVMAMVSIRRARALALSTQPDPGSGPVRNDLQVGKLLDEATHAFDRGRTDRDPDWAQFYEEAWHISEEGRVWSLLGNHQRALGHADDAISSYTGGTRRRSIQLNRLEAAKAHLAMGDLEQSLACARLAVPAVKSLTSTRAAHLAHRFADRLEPYGTSPHVREFRDLLKAELSA